MIVVDFWLDVGEFHVIYLLLFYLLDADVFLFLFLVLLLRCCPVFHIEIDFAIEDAENPLSSSDAQFLLSMFMSAALLISNFGCQMFFCVRSRC